MIDETHDPTLRSWVASATGHTVFPVQNLPFGIFSLNDGLPGPGVAIGDSILDLSATARSGLLKGFPSEGLSAHALNELFSWPQGVRRALRRRLSSLLTTEEHREILEPLLLPLEKVAMHLPAAIGDYTDFYAGIHHAENVGRLFRPDNPLLPNYKYVPIGYHGRASSVRVSGNVVRPHGQRKAPDANTPMFGPSQRLDYELELGLWIGPGSVLGHLVPIEKAARHIVGFCLLNDWSARDIQAWEYQPLGPFLAKNFMTTVSPWVVTAEALAPFRIAQPARPQGDPQPLAYLWDEDDQQHGSFNIELEVNLLTARMRQAGMPSFRLGKTAASNMYWTAAQMVAHHTSNGCNLNAGDLMGTGTISAASEEGYGSLLEISRGGRQPLALPNGEQRTFLEDGDEIIFTATAHAEGYVPIGFGICRGVIEPASL